MPGHSSAGQTHSSRSPREKLQVHKKRKVDRGGRAENGGPNLLPLLSDQNVAHGGNGRRGRETTSSEDEEDTEWRRQTLLLDTPRRPRPLGYAQFATPDGYPVAPPTASRSYAALDCTVPCNAGYLRSHHRHPFPRHGYDDCSDEDFAAPASRRYGHDKHGHPRRSFSQDSVRRPSRHRHHCATQSPLLDRNYFPPGPSTNPRRPSFARLPSDCEDDGFQATPLVPPIGLRQRVHDDDSSQEGTSPAPFRDRGKAERPRPAAVRVREDCNLMYSDCFQRPSEDDGDSATGEDVMYRPYEAGNVADAAGLAEMGPQCFSQSHPRRTSEEEPSRGGPQYGGASGSRNVNQVCTISVCLPVCPFVCLSCSLCVYLHAHLSVSLSFSLSICLPICLSLFLCLSVCLSSHLSVCPLSLSICLPICLSFFLSLSLPACLPICLSLFLFFCLPACPCVCLSVFLSLCLSACASVSLSFTLSLSVCLTTHLSVFLSLSPSLIVLR